MIRGLGAALALLTALLCAAPPAPAQPTPAAQPAPGEPAAAGDAPAGALLSPSDRLDPGNYRGRPREADPVDGLLWIPRILFLPVFAVAEFGVRRPIYTGAEWVDRHKVVPIVERILKPTPDISWSPLVTLDLNANSSVGAKAKWRNMLVPGHELRVSAETGGIDTWHFTARDRWEIGPHVTLGARGDLQRVPNRAFFGLGPLSPGDRTNFDQARYDGVVFQGLQLDNHLRVELSEGYRFERTGPGWGPSVETRFSPGSIPAYGDDLRLALVALDFQIDSRRFPEENGGARLVGNVTGAQDTAVAERRFLTASLDFEAAVEVSHPDRVLVARGLAVETVALGREPVPFTHQAMLGWKDHTGFIWGRFRGDTALLAEVQYRYPIAYFVDAQWTLSAGNVFGPRFEGLSVGAMTGTIGVGLRTRRAGFTPIEVTFALGTSRFDEPFSFDALRVYFGTTEGL